MMVNFFTSTLIDYQFLNEVLFCNNYFIPYQGFFMLHERIRCVLLLLCLKLRNILSRSKRHLIRTVIPFLLVFYNICFSCSITS